MRDGSRRDTALLVAGNGASLFGDGMFVVAIGFAVLAVGGGAGALGVILLVGVVAIFTCIVPAGVFVDRVSRRRVIVAADIARGVLQLTAAAIVAWPGATWWYLLPTSLLFGMVTALHQPATMSFTAEVVPSSQLEQVNGGLQVLRGVGLIVGGAIAGVIVSAWGAVPVMIVDACTFLVCAACIFAIREPPTPSHEPPTPLHGPPTPMHEHGDMRRFAPLDAAAIRERPTPTHEHGDMRRLEPRAAPRTVAAAFDDVRAAIAVVRTERWLTHGLLLIAGFVVVSYAPIQVIGPSAAREASGAAGVSAAALWAWISAATAFGMIVGGVLAFVRPPSRMLAAVRLLLVLGAAGPTALALGVQPFATLPGFAALGGAMGLFSSGWESAKQARIEPRMLARIASLDMLAQLGGMMVGVVIAALVATFVDVDAVLLAVGGGCLVLGIASQASPVLGDVFVERARELEESAASDL